MHFSAFIFSPINLYLSNWHEQSIPPLRKMFNSLPDVLRRFPAIILLENLPGRIFPGKVVDKLGEFLYYCIDTADRTPPLPGRGRFFPLPCQKKRMGCFFAQQRKQEHFRRTTQPWTTTKPLTFPRRTSPCGRACRPASLVCWRAGRRWTSTTSC